jgi:hypothetical protein
MTCWAVNSGCVFQIALMRMRAVVRQSKYHPTCFCAELRWAAATWHSLSSLHARVEPSGCSSPSLA